MDDLEEKNNIAN